MFEQVTEIGCPTGVRWPTSSEVGDTNPRRHLISRRIAFVCVVLAAVMSLGTSAPGAEPTGHLNRVRTTLDNLIRYGTDRYGKVHSPLLAAILAENTLVCPQDPPEHPLDPLRLDPGRYKNRRSPGGCNLAYDQATLRCMDLMSQITGDRRYRKAALAAIGWLLEHTDNGHGLPVLGGHTYWHFYMDKMSHQGPHHELWNWPMAWELWWAANPERTRRYADLVWKWHVVDKKTGETNRHSDGKPGWAFTFTDATFISLWSFVGAQTKDAKYRGWCETVAAYHWNRRDPKTNLFPSSGGASAERHKRGDAVNFTTMQSVLARHLIVAGQQLGSDKLTMIGRSILNAYAKYGYDAKTGLFDAALKRDGTPVQPDAERLPVTGQDAPVGYLATWQPHAGWQELPLPMAQVYAWAAEVVDRDAYLITAQRFGRVLRRAWKDRYAGHVDWFAYAQAMQSNPARLASHKNVVSRNRYAETPDADAKLVAAYKKGGYVTQAPFGLFADHYGRLIQFALTMRRLTGDVEWLALARQAADAAIWELWRGRIFVGHVAKTHYYNTDHVGILLYALLQLDAATGGHDVKIDPFF